MLHEQSFVDDPTRLLRAARYAARLDLALELETERLALTAVEDGALLTISGPRVRHELLLLLAETDPGKAVERLTALGIPQALHPELDPDPELVAGAELGAMETDADRVLAGLAAMVSADPLSLGTWLERLQLPAPERDRIARAAGAAPRVVTALRLRDQRPPSQLARLLAGEPPETLALALALGAPPGVDPGVDPQPAPRAAGDHRRRPGARRRARVRRHRARAGGHPGPQAGRRGQRPRAGAGGRAGDRRGGVVSKRPSRSSSRARTSRSRPASAASARARTRR